MNKTQRYISLLQKEHGTGIAKEHAYRPALKAFVESIGNGVHAVNDPARQACGAPDFVVSRERRNQRIDVGYIETKDVGATLEHVAVSEQVQRYLKSLGNFLLTDYLNFWLFREGVRVATVRVAEVRNGKIVPAGDVSGELETLLGEFIEYSGQTIRSAKTLAQMMARKAQLMRDVFSKVLGDKAVKSTLHEQLEAFRKILIHDLDEVQFADVYAQTITYGLFTARLHDKTLADFSRQEARDLIPRSNPFLRRLFDYVCGVDLDARVVWMVDALCEVYRAADVHAILHDFGSSTGRNDPIVHFYETFLGEYDPKLRKARGVWYTPEPVVNFIVRAIDDVLQTEFGLADGLADTSKVKIEVADQAFEATKRRGQSGGTRRATKTVEVHKVQLLDVAIGTGTFTAEAVKQIHSRFKGQEGMWSNYVEQHLLPRVHGFEILMASYAVCHLKIDMLLTELGYKPSKPDNPPRLSVYLTNALEEHHPDADTLFASWLAQEANAASRVKRDMPIMVAYGNPPYSVSSQNRGEWIQKLIADYKHGLDEKKLNLDDDYIKFMRYAEHFIERTGFGVVALITNNSFLDGITHRVMRRHLLATFDDIFILNLHGDSNKKEKAPDGTPDKNVFDIQQGVAISVFVKKGPSQRTLARVSYADLYGSRQEKYDWLFAGSIRSEPFKKLITEPPNFFFVPKDLGETKAYEAGFSIQEAFRHSQNGMKTERDGVTIHFDREALLATMNDFLSLSEQDIRIKYDLGKDSRDWKIQGAVSDLRRHAGQNLFALVDYRPFDIRHTFYTGTSKGFIGTPAHSVMKHVIGKDNISLSLPRQVPGNEMSGGLITKHIPAHKVFSAYNINTVFPLYLYADAQGGQSSFDEGTGRQHNLDSDVVSKFAKKLGLPFVSDHLNKGAADRSCFSPRDVLDYIYATLHSPTYRERYKELLRIDFPRIPYPRNAQVFWSLAYLGGELRQLHVMEHPILAKLVTKFPVAGSCSVEKPNIVGRRVYINQTQYFDDVPETAWNFEVGGYQPAQKWLKDRKGRTLSVEELRHWQQIIVALVNSDRLMAEIDKVQVD